MTHTEALKRALEALEDISALQNHSDSADSSDVDKAITAIKEALAQPEQEPVATVTSETGADITMSWWHEPALPIGTKLYTTSPQRKPLTDEEMWQLWNSQGDDAMEQQAAITFARAIEAKLKEKNT
jgi:hypothetical protein